MSITLSSLSGRNSEEFAFLMPRTFLANSMTATCIPRHIPKKGILLVLAHLTASIFPSTPLYPKPPGTRMPSTSEKISSSVSLFTVSLSTHLMSTVAPNCHEACFNASITERYASWSSIYFPTIAIVTFRSAEWILSTISVHSERSIGRSGRPRIFTAT